MIVLDMSFIIDYVRGLRCLKRRKKKEEKVFL